MANTILPSQKIKTFFVVLFAVFFWTFLWGLAGAFIGVPIVIAMLTLCEQHPSGRWVVELFGPPPRDHD